MLQRGFELRSVILQNHDVLKCKAARVESNVLDLERVKLKSHSHLYHCLCVGLVGTGFDHLVCPVLVPAGGVAQLVPPLAVAGCVDVAVSLLLRPAPAQPGHHRPHPRQVQQGVRVEHPVNLDTDHRVIIIIITIIITWARVLPRVSGSMTSPNTRAAAATLLNRKKVPDRDRDWGGGEYIYTLFISFHEKGRTET